MGDGSSRVAKRSAASLQRLCENRQASERSFQKFCFLLEQHCFGDAFGYQKSL
jgi:hypothetical protein